MGKGLRRTPVFGRAQRVRKCMKTKGGSCCRRTKSAQGFECRGVTGKIRSGRGGAPVNHGGRYHRSKQLAREFWRTTGQVTAGLRARRSRRQHRITRRKIPTLPGPAGVNAKRGLGTQICSGTLSPGHPSTSLEAPNKLPLLSFRAVAKTGKYVRNGIMLCLRVRKNIVPYFVEVIADGLGVCFRWLIHACPHAPEIAFKKSPVF
jgi:hypothetical protein